MFGLKKRRRKRLMEQPFPGDWLMIVRHNVPYFARLPEEKKKLLLGLIQVFLDEKIFEGCGGLELTEEIKVTIATQACILILGNPDEIYPSLRSILVYPHRYFAKIKDHKEGGIVEEGSQPRFGESWSRGNVVLAWDNVQHGASNIHDGQNLVFHEFAHQLDREYGATSMIDSPPENDAEYLEWARVIGREYHKLIHDLQQHNRTLMDAYGAKNLAEFFAVATETFFEQPLALRRQHPGLYEQLKLFYRQNPAEYSDENHLE